jgi:F-type H+-transporting ATPase subunit gamma
MRNIQEKYPSVIKNHPYTTPHPELSKTHVILISMKNGLFCQPALNRLFDYLQSTRSDESISFTAVGNESQKLITRLNEPSIHSETVSDQTNLVKMTETLTREVQDKYLRSGIGTIRIVNIQNNFEPQDIVLLPLPVNVSEGKQNVLNHDGDSNAAVDTLLKHVISTEIYDALLETQEAEHFSRMLASHRAVENIDETLPELQLNLNRTRRDKTTKQILELSQ